MFPDSKTLDDYGKITLSFGKYKGCTLFEVVRVDPLYLRWLHTTLSLDNNKPKSPTVLAILKFIQYNNVVLNLNLN